ncbi:hypothetical protein CRM22_005163 [Opisthorchis felineus]|uniref:Peptidase S54 rhomboid domain-containing protein n=1 Tax=Opisthorchis felineus TaxID=147828 RepID=A0A4V3SF10_OPIFE|nr:hypothetical protein CRM22_005163 [Opisthorchis felineus]
MYRCAWQLRPIMAIQLIFYAFSFIPAADVYLAITPGRFFMPNYHLWTIFTFSFYNYSVFFLLSDLLTLFLLDILLSFYSWCEMLKFCAVVNLTTAFSTMCFLFLGYAITFDTELLFSEKICGFIPLLGGLTVVARQTMGGKLLVNFPLGNIRYKHIPFISVVLAALLASLGITGRVSFMMFATGILVAWFYLRFFQKHSNGIVGDLADTFTFSGFFPNHLEPPVAILANTTFNLLLRLKLCRKAPVISVKQPASVMSFTVNISEISRASDIGHTNNPAAETLNLHVSTDSSDLSTSANIPMISKGTTPSSSKENS